MAGMPPTPFRLTVEPVGGTLEVDGIGIPPDKVLAAEVIMAPGEATRVLVHVTGAGVIEGEGIIQTIRDAPSGDVVRALDPDLIRAAVADKLSYGTDASAAYRDAIADLVDRSGAGP